MLKVGVKIYRLGYMRLWCNGTMRYESVINVSEVALFIYNPCIIHYKSWLMAPVRSDSHSNIKSCPVIGPPNTTSSQDSIPLYIFKTPWYHGIYGMNKANLHTVY